METKYQCEECLSTFKKKFNYDRHKNRKNPCAYICENCNGLYKSKGAYKSHIKVCGVENTVSIDNICEYCGIACSTKFSKERHYNACKNIPASAKESKQLILNLQRENNALKRENNVLRKTQTPVIQQNNGTIVNGNYTVNNVDNRTIVNNTNILLMYGKEDKHISLDKLFELYQKNEIGTLHSAMLREVHANPERPQNRNVCYDSANKKYLKYDGANWNEVPAKELHDNTTKWIQTVTQNNHIGMQEAYEEKYIEVHPKVMTVVMNKTEFREYNDDRDKQFEDCLACNLEIKEKLMNGVIAN